MTLVVHKANREAVNYHKVTLERNRDGTTAKEPVVKREKSNKGKRTAREVHRRSGDIVGRTERAQPTAGKANHWAATETRKE